MQGGDNNQFVDWLYIYGTPDNEIIGALDYSTGFMGAAKSMTISQGQTINLTFNNHGNGALNWNNWLVRLSGTEGVNHTLRADNFVIGDANSEVSTRTITEDGNSITWDDFLVDMTDSEVEMTITYGADGMFTIAATSECPDHTYTHSFAYNDAKSGDITVELGVERAWLEVLSVSKTVSATIGAAGYASFSSTSALDLDKMTDGYAAYVVTVKPAGDVVVLTQATGTVAANTGLILKGAAGTVTIPVAVSGSEVDGNLLVAVTSDTEVAADNYILAAQKMVSISSQVLKLSRQARHICPHRP